MEFRRARADDPPDEGLVAGTGAASSRCCTGATCSRRRGLPSLRLLADGGGVNEDVFAYSNRARRRARAGALPQPLRGGPRMDSRLRGVRREARRWLTPAAPDHPRRVARPRPGGRALHALPRSRRRSGVPVPRGRPRGARPVRGAWAYGSRVLLDWREVPEDGRPWGVLCDALARQGTPSLDERLLEHELEPVQHALAAVAEVLPALGQPRRRRAAKARPQERPDGHARRVRATGAHASSSVHASSRAVPGRPSRGSPRPRARRATWPPRSPRPARRSRRCCACPRWPPIGRWRPAPTPGPCCRSPRSTTA